MRDGAWSLVEGVKTCLLAEMVSIARGLMSIKGVTCMEKLLGTVKLLSSLDFWQVTMVHLHDGTNDTKIL